MLIANFVCYQELLCHSKLNYFFHFFVVQFDKNFDVSLSYTHASKNLTRFANLQKYPQLDYHFKVRMVSD